MLTFLSFLLIPWIFYTLLLAGVISIVYFHENEKVAGSHTIFIILLCLLAYRFNFSIIYLRDNCLEILKYIGIYIAIGFGWAFLKWIFYLKNAMSEYNFLKNRAQLEWNKMDDIAKKNYKNLIAVMYSLKNSDYKNYHFDIKQNYSKKDNYEIQIPDAIENKSLIISWITHWPISAAWTVVNDPIKKFINYLFGLVKNIFQKISNQIFKDAINDFK